jgi:decaprenylphospho-beta-D-ribofuranose 2-oxidase
MEISGWGKYPVVDALVNSPQSNEQIKRLLADSDSAVIARGQGRSYGDSSLSSNILKSDQLDHFLSFNGSTGLLRCAAGVTLQEILDVFVPKGWFLPVTPGTKYVSVGGAVASDVHGKNHHLDGTFCDHVTSLKIVTGPESIVSCSRRNHADLFYATCGGMGLTGMITEVSLKLMPVNSAYMTTTTIKASNLDEAFELFETHQQARYSVAWIDCLSTGKSLGRSLVSLADHEEEGSLETAAAGKLAVPIEFPNFVLNKFSIQAFNTLYYRRVTRKESTARQHFDPYFYPLDGIRDWNRMYGKNGFVQYQFVLPTRSGLSGMTEILQAIAQSKRGSFLAVLKAFGKENKNYLSFPIEGYSLALDFKLDAGLFDFLDQLDEIVLKHEGRLYLTKDSRMSESMFKATYPDWKKLVDVREKYGITPYFYSRQAQRLGI